MTRRWPLLFLVPTVMVCWAPFYFTVVVASRSAEAAAAMPPPLLPGPELLSNAQRVWEAVPIGAALVNSLVVSTGVAIGQALLCAVAGFAFAKVEFRGRTILFVLTLIALCVPSQLNVLPRYFQMGWLGWIDTLPALIVPGLASAFGVLWMRQHISAAVPDDVIDAAALDGCGPWRTFRHVAFPLLRPATAVLAGIAFVASWGDYFWPFLVARSPATQTVQVALGALQSGFWVDHSLVFAGALITTAPMLLLLLAASGAAWRRVV